MPLTVLVSEGATTLIWTAELTHVKYVAYLARDFHLFKLLLAHGAVCVPD